MKARVKRGKKTRAKSYKEARRDAGKAFRKKKTQIKKKFDYPVTETLHWVADGERLLRKWGAIKSPAAKRVARGVTMVLAVLETAVGELRRV